MMKVVLERQAKGRNNNVPWLLIVSTVHVSENLVEAAQHAPEAAHWQLQGKRRGQ